LVSPDRPWREFWVSAQQHNFSDSDGSESNTRSVPDWFTTEDDNADLGSATVSHTSQDTLFVCSQLECNNLSHNECCNRQCYACCVKHGGTICSQSIHPNVVRRSLP
jgi:hypothetical protein